MPLKILQNTIKLNQRNMFVAHKFYRFRWNLFLNHIIFSIHIKIYRKMFYSNNKILNVIFI